MRQETENLTNLLVGLFNVALRPQGKVMSAALTERLRVALHDATAQGDPLYDLLDDLIMRATPGERAARTTVAFERDVPAEVERWRRQRGEDE